MRLRKLWIFINLALFPFFLSAADSKDKSKEKPTEKIAPLSSEQLNLEMLDTAQAFLAKAPASLRAHACYQAAMAYGLADATREIPELKQCFRYTQELEEKDSALRESLQLRILDALYSKDPGVAEELAPYAGPKARMNIQSRILERLVAGKKYDEAIALVSGLSYSPDFPYRAAADLMVHLGSGRTDDRRTVFLTALQSYRLEDSASDPRLEDIATLVVRFWRDLDAKLVMQAVDEILDHARKDSKNQSAPMLTIGTAQGEAQFSSTYQYRLFELVPIIQTLDPSLAASILDDNPRLADVLKNYPQGLQSLEPTFRDSPLNAGEFPQFTLTHRLQGADDQGAGEDLMRQRLARESMENTKLATSNPREAIEKAAQLPDTGVEETGRSPRGDALARIALMYVAQKPSIAEEAVKQMLKFAGDYPLLARGFYQLSAANIYLQMNERAEASRLIENAASTAAGLYQRDAMSDHPNRAFKFDWPSAAVWRACVVLQNKVNPALTNSLLEKISDPEIRANAQITLVNIRLGGTVSANTVRQQFGDGPGSVQDFPMIR